jgi:hypothetical protein
MKPDPTIFYALHDANVDSETCLRRAGYSVKDSRAVASMKHKLLTRRGAAVTLPAVPLEDQEETDPELIRIWE